MLLILFKFVISRQGQSGNFDKSKLSTGSSSNLKLSDSTSFSVIRRNGDTVRNTKLILRVRGFFYGNGIKPIPFPYFITKIYVAYLVRDWICGYASTIIIIIIIIR